MPMQDSWFALNANAGSCGCPLCPLRQVDPSPAPALVGSDWCWCRTRRGCPCRMYLCSEWGSSSWLRGVDRNGESTLGVPRLRSALSTNWCPAFALSARGHAFMRCHLHPPCCDTHLTFTAGGAFLESNGLTFKA